MTPYKIYYIDGGVKYYVCKRRVNDKVFRFVYVNSPTKAKVFKYSPFELAIKQLKQDVTYYQDFHRVKNEKTNRTAR